MLPPPSTRLATLSGCALAMILAACGPADERSADPTPAPAPGSTPGTSAAPAPVASGSEAVAAPADAPVAAPRRPNVLLISIDTLRADRLGCYGNPRDTSPWIDSLAARGVQFLETSSQATQTLSSHASLFTSLLPPQIGLVRADGQNVAQHVTRLRVPDAAVTLAEVFADAGYATAAFTGGALVDPRFGLGQGFGHFQAAVGYDESGLAHSLPWLLDWLDERLAGPDADQPLFLFLHTFDVHDPYRAAPPFERAFSPRSAMEFQEQLGLPPNVPSLERAAPLGSPELVSEVLSLYDNGIRWVDEQLAGLEGALRARGLWDDLVVALVSDHGEEFQEHGGWGHGPRVHAEVLHVPFVLRLPGDAHAGTRVDDAVALLDVAPTLADAAALPPSSTWRGHSWMPLLDDPSAPAPTDRLLYADNQDALHDVRSVVRDGYRLILDYTLHNQQLFDLAADPGETRSVAAEQPERASALRQAFEAWLVEIVAQSQPFVAVPMEAGSETHWEAEQEMLRELGYVR